MQPSRFQTIKARFSTHNLRTSFRRSSSTSSASSTRSSTRDSYLSSSPVGSTINSIIFRQPSLVDLEEERKSFGPELNILEPRPVVFFGSLEERMGSF
jgi:hypothetical protein